MTQLYVLTSDCSKIMSDNWVIYNIACAKQELAMTGDYFIACDVYFEMDLLIMKRDSVLTLNRRPVSKST